MKDPLARKSFRLKRIDGKRGTPGHKPADYAVVLDGLSMRKGTEALPWPNRSDRVEAIVLAVLGSDGNSVRKELQRIVDDLNAVVRKHYQGGYIE